jgi:hypothetical protein
MGWGQYVYLDVACDSDDVCVKEPFWCDDDDSNNRNKQRTRNNPFRLLFLALPVVVFVICKKCRR